MNAAELITALESLKSRRDIDPIPGAVGDGFTDDTDAFQAWIDERTVIEAARTIALPILEADSELVERIAEVLWRADQGDWYRLEGHADKNARDLLEISRHILAAISTPTPVETQ